MRGRFSLIGRFRSDERGAFAMIFAVLAIVLVATSGAVVDFTSMQQARTRAQVALDAAALALQPRIYTYSTAQLENSAQALVTDRLDDNRAQSWAKCAASGALVPPCVNVDTANVDTNEGTLTLEAQLSVPMYFVSLVGFPQLNFRIESQATRKKLNLEVAMVLDNSGSMDERMGGSTAPKRMDVLKASAACAVNILFYGVTDCSTSTSGLTAKPDVKMAVIPFTSEVNVGASNASAAWLDRAGTWTGAVADDNFDSDDDSSNVFSGPVDRVALFSGMSRNGSPLSWGGCVEARLNPYDTTDDPPVAGTATMFTPFLAPDEPDSGFSNDYISDTPNSCPVVPTCVQVQIKTPCNSDSYNSCGASPTSTVTSTNANRTVTHPGSCPTTSSPQTQVDYDSSWTRTGSYRDGYTYVYTNTKTTTYTYPPYSFSNRVLQERLCKYSGASLKFTPSRTAATGPNGDCPATAIQPLTASASSVIAAINSMQSAGATNIHAGTVWGWRVLSPTEPFTQGRSYDQATSKVLIVMTDGENTAYPVSNMNGTNIYQAFGYPYNNRTIGGQAHVRLGAVGDSASTLEGYMNTRLSTTCANAKSAGITVYTIGLAVDETSNPSANRTLLTDCASAPANAYFPASAADLQDAFVSIAQQLAALRLSR
jgi:Flp pilus assembly protein TadG